MRRRDLILGIAGSAAMWPLAVRAQNAPLIGYLHAGSAASNKEQQDAFRSGMTDLGYVEGRNIRYESRFAEGQIDRLPGLAGELVRLNPAVIVSSPLPANTALKNATSTIPIVMAS